MTQQRSISEAIPDLPSERAYSALTIQLQKLQELKRKDCRTAAATEKEWFQLTEKLMIRSFGSLSTNCRNFKEAGTVGAWFRGGPNYVLDQKYFEDRLNAYEAALRSTIDELRLDLPENALKGVYEPGEQYEFYRDVTACLKLGRKEIFVIDPYLDTEIFDVYASAIQRSVAFRLLSAKVPPEVMALAQKYSAGGNFVFRSSISIHDRVLFADSRVWLTGQSLKDAAKKKPTYIVEHDEPLMRQVYESIWQGATIIQ